jgi:hypothetical protein
LLVGTCISSLYPEIYSSFVKKWKNVSEFCLESYHYNQLFSKLVDILVLGRTKKVGFLTVDGSPHCTQMHFCSYFLKRILGNGVKYEHYVVGDGGKVYKVSMKDIKKARKFAKIGKKIKD